MGISLKKLEGQTPCPPLHFAFLPSLIPHPEAPQTQLGGLGSAVIEWWGYQMVKKFENTFIRLIVLTECTSVTDTRTDGQTPHDGKGRA